ncbi:TRAP transporter small permease [Pararhodobacter sp.]|jgi:TRAP-type C4-dicarboxylate transport system permease small subunit|uniref:TRAP transporter small permease n=1 Tax=Pararhodobacter sp. TaxID=2127056 RepID=UPI002FDD729D
MIVHRISDGWARIEMIAAAVLAAVVSVLILYNVVTRAMRQAVFWVDEAAIYAMVAMAFFAASASIAQREAISITLIVDMLSVRAQRVMWLFVDLVTLGAGALLIWACWIWFDPLTLIAVDFDLRAFRSQTFNFIYAEPTSTLRMPKFWFWLVMPVFALGFTLHAFSNLLKTLAGRIPTPQAARENAP